MIAWFALGKTLAFLRRVDEINLSRGRKGPEERRGWCSGESNEVGQERTKKPMKQEDLVAAGVC